MHIFRHFRTITHHRHLVIAHCFRCGIGLQGLRHDLSKYSPAEFFTGCKYFTGTHSPNEGERKEKGYSSSWMHHKGRNKHHFEYWTDISPVSKLYEPVKMPYNYLVEMFCDRIAASKTYMGEKYGDGCSLDYFLRGNGKDEMHPDTARELERLLRMLAEKGEKETFSYVSAEVKRKKKAPFDYAPEERKKE
ncbi:MAG: catalase [Clostridia bacterium]|nr:catalase [Clostridia bacterium]